MGGCVGECVDGWDGCADWSMEGYVDGWMSECVGGSWMD